jgi:protein-disulfide isomerase
MRYADAIIERPRKVDVRVYRSRFFLGFCLLATTLAGCRAQVPAPSTPAASTQSALDRRIEVLVRSQLNVPNNWEIAVGSRTPSTTAGFDKVTLSFTPPADPASAAPPHTETLDFLLSKDGTHLARLTTWDLLRTPADTIEVAGRPVRGPLDAKVEIVNYDDLQCPYCARMHAELFPETLDHYKGLVKVVYKDDPLVEIHPWALHAAVDANCLAGLSPTAYWSYVDYLHSHGEDVTGPDRDPARSSALLDKLAREEGARAKVSPAPLDSCLTRQDDGPVRASMKEADGLHIDGTPTLFINGERIAGAQPVTAVWTAIDRALRAEGITPPPNLQAPARTAGIP